MGQRIEVKPGDKYGRLTIVRESEKIAKKRYFICECSCGKEINARFVSLRAGHIKSCGCLRDEQNRTVAITHGDHKSRIYSTWHSMKQRCTNPNSKAAKWYIDKGIKVCDEWIKYENFKEWALKNGYSDNLTIDRKNSKGNYEPENCRWITQREQTRNTSRNRMITYNGETLCVTEWAEKYGIKRSTLAWRLKKHSFHESVTL